jgi:predicted acylesterase/phospholipase RssA
MVQIKFIFQGGGAKLATLIAAVEAIEDLHEEIEVTETAGTSAGSVAAFMLAHRAPCKELRYRMKPAAASIIDHFSKKPSKIMLAYKIIAGGAVYDEKIVRDFFRAVFAFSDGDRVSLKDAKVPVYFCVSDIRQGAKVIYGPTTDLPLEEALLDSCAIPVAFRSHKSRSPRADGGIMANLADHSIFTSGSEKIIAFSFDREKPAEFSDAQSYFSSLAGACIANSVAEAHSRIEAAGGYVIRLPNDFDTFDFRKALDVGLSDDYVNKTKDFVKAKIKEALRKFAEDDRRMECNFEDRRGDNFSTALIQSVAKCYPYGVSSNAIICIAHGLEIEGVGTQKADRLIKDVTIVPKQDALLAFRVGITANEAFGLGKDVRWEIKDRNGVTLEAHHEVITSIQDEVQVWHSCFCLKEPVGADRGPLRIVSVTSHVGLMQALAVRGGAEWMRARCHQNDNVSLQEFILFFPKAAGPLKATELLENFHRATVTPPGMSDIAANWCSGRRMTASELKRFSDVYLHLTGFDCIGWCCSDVPPGAWSGTLIERVGVA